MEKIEKMKEFIFKIVLLSLILSLLIKYAGPFLSVPATSVSVILGITLPTLAMAIILAWRQRYSE